MTNAIYPERPYDNGRALISQIGAFWENVFTDNAKLEQMFQGYMLQAAQTHWDDVVARARAKLKEVVDGLAALERQIKARC